ncbi:unnamed protein product [Acanthoscelides obtectus]|uniref:Uncharacterized protein n=1 Tax=Acanthoscelides obtectus TaxID=200917 RepID=A0A9P0KUH6_ACAOB|nr:unnamed protein product [Acanthoscelides obtectus]CAK1677027.1 b(0,+)-type amino acid transporter 1 [Acanthoscelides obtectus]
MTSELSIAQPAKSNGGIQLKKELGLFSAVNFILAIMIGSGIFVSPASALKYSGSVGMCLVVWVTCGLISLLGALAYAELGPLVPRSGSEYAYFVDSFGPLHKFWGHLPAFVYSWIMILVIRPAEVAILVLTFSQYLCQPILDMLCMEDPVHADRMIKSLALAALGNTMNLSNGFEGTSTSPKDIALAFYCGLWAYDGWSGVTIVTEEIRRPEVNILRSILIAVPIVTILYVFMNVAYMSVLTQQEMITAHDQQQAVAVLFGERVLGSTSFLIPLGVALSTFGCALTLQFGVTRLCYVSGQDGFMLESLCYVHYKRLTPAPAVILQGLISFAFILAGDIQELIEFASFLIWFFYGVAMISLLVLRKTRKNANRPYKVPVIIPVFILLISIYLSVAPIILEPSPKYLMAVIFMLFGGLVYYWFVYQNRKPERLMGSVTRYIQLLFQVVPPSTES